MKTKKENNINSFIISHTVYAKGIAPRIAMTKNIKVFLFGLCLENNENARQYF